METDLNSPWGDCDGLVELADPHGVACVCCVGSEAQATRNSSWVRLKGTTKSAELTF